MKTNLMIAQEDAMQKWESLAEFVKTGALKMRQCFSKILAEDEYLDYIDFVSPDQYYALYEKTNGEFADKTYAKDYVKTFMSIVGASFKLVNAANVSETFGIRTALKDLHHLNCRNDSFSFTVDNYSYQDPTITIVFTENNGISFVYAESSQIALERASKDNYLIELYLNDSVTKPFFQEPSITFEKIGQLRTLLNNTAENNIIFIEMNNGKKSIIHEQTHHDDDQFFGMYGFKTIDSFYDLRDLKKITGIFSKEIFVVDDEHMPVNYAKSHDQVVIEDLEQRVNDNYLAVKLANGATTLVLSCKKSEMSIEDVDNWDGIESTDNYKYYECLFYSKKIAHYKDFSVTTYESREIFIHESYITKISTILSPKKTKQ